MNGNNKKDGMRRERQKRKYGQVGIPIKYMAHNIIPVPVNAVRAKGKRMS